MQLHNVGVVLFSGRVCFEMTDYSLYAGPFLPIESEWGSPIIRFKVAVLGVQVFGPAMSQLLRRSRHNVRLRFMSCLKEQRLTTPASST